MCAGFRDHLNLHQKPNTTTNSGIKVLSASQTATQTKFLQCAPTEGSQGDLNVIFPNCLLVKDNIEAFVLLLLTKLDRLSGPWHYGSELETNCFLYAQQLEPSTTIKRPW